MLTTQLTRRRLSVAFFAEFDSILLLFTSLLPNARQRKVNLLVIWLTVSYYTTKNGKHFIKWQRFSIRLLVTWRWSRDQNRPNMVIDSCLTADSHLTHQHAVVFLPCADWFRQLSCVSMTFSVQSSYTDRSEALDSRNKQSAITDLVAKENHVSKNCSDAKSFFLSLRRRKEGPNLQCFPFWKTIVQLIYVQMPPLYPPLLQSSANIYL